MGPCSVWLTEALTSRMPLERGSNVVDLGCGKAMSSVFLAREFGVRVTAADLWIDARDNQQRIDGAGLADLVRPVQVDARDLILPDSGFDALVSVDAFHYFADEPGVIATLARVVRPGGRFGIVVPGLGDGVDEWPDHLADHWQEGFSTFNDPAWWERLWSEEPTVHLDGITTVPWGGNDDWICWADTCDDWARATGRPPYELEARMLRADTTGALVFVMITATKL